MVAVDVISLLVVIGDNIVLCVVHQGEIPIAAIVSRVVRLYVFDTVAADRPAVIKPPFRKISVEVFRFLSGAFGFLDNRRERHTLVPAHRHLIVKPFLSVTGDKIPFFLDGIGNPVIGFCLSAGIGLSGVKFVEILCRDGNNLYARVIEKSFVIIDDRRAYVLRNSPIMCIRSVLCSVSTSYLKRSTEVSHISSSTTSLLVARYSSKGSR